MMPIDQTGDQITSESPPQLSELVTHLMRGVQYRENNGEYWTSLLRLQHRVRDYVAVLGLDLVVDEAEGYAFLRSHNTEDENDGGDSIPRLVARRPLSFNVSLILALLRKKLAEFDAGGGETRLVLSRDEVAELVRVFLPETSNEVRLIDQIDTHLKKIVELGFLRRLKSTTGQNVPTYEVCRILKAFVDAQWLADFDDKLAAYAAHYQDARNE
ncbi:MAG: DUF4194 domain-containing protein [Pseudohongiellaceae bacterium]